MKLKDILLNIDFKGYKHYKILEKKEFYFKDFSIFFSHIQSDPYAPPSAAIIKVKSHNIPLQLRDSFDKRVALIDYLHREFFRNINDKNIIVPKPLQKVLYRSIGFFDNDDTLVFKINIQLPAKGRRILANEAIKIILNNLPKIVQNSLFYDSLDKDKLNKHIELYLDQQFIRDFLKKNNALVFIANGSILPRESGISDKPLKNAIKFISPSSIEVEIKLPSGNIIRGALIKEGVNIITGGGFHGKTTLLEAIEAGIYNHIKGDGREFVITRDDAVKIRAEDGRYVADLDISPFIRNLPYGKDTKRFYTLDSSGSTSQAANIIEALEAGSRFILIDEDTSATNFMVKDEIISNFITHDIEPIIPFLYRVREIYEKYKISSIIITGGVGEYLKVADRVFLMREYKMEDITIKVKDFFKTKNSNIKNYNYEDFYIISPRRLKENVINPYKGKKIKIKSKDKTTIIFGNYSIDTSKIETIISSNQLKTIGEIVYLSYKKYGKKYNIVDMVEKFLEDIKINNFENLLVKDSPSYILPRKYEIIFALHRLRSVRYKI